MRATMTFAARPAHAITGAAASALALVAAADGVARLATEPGPPVASLVRVAVAVVALILVVFHLAAVLRARRRPVLAVGDGWFDYAPPEAIQARRVRAEDVQGVAWSGDDALGIRLASGEVLDLNLYSLPKPVRKQATTAVRSFVSRHTSPGSGT